MANTSTKRDLAGLAGTLIQRLLSNRILSAEADTDLRRWIHGFLIAKQAAGLAAGTLNFYKFKLSNFVAFCETIHVADIESIDASLIREWLLALTAAGHRPGGAAAHYRSLKAFMLWYETESAADGWRNPIRKVPAPKVPEELLEPVQIAQVKVMLAQCDDSKLGIRDRAILLTLLDTGVRASELLAADLGDFEPIGGVLTVRRGKGGKGRIVFAGQRTRRALRAWLKARGPEPGPLFTNRTLDRLKYYGLAAMLRRRAATAGVHPAPMPHAFRRAFALSMLRGGADLISIQRLLGHSDLSVLKRYVKQTADDLQTMHAAHSPVDQGGW